MTYGVVGAPLPGGLNLVNDNVARSSLAYARCTKQISQDPMPVSKVIINE